MFIVEIGCSESDSRIDRRIDHGVFDLTSWQHFQLASGHVKVEGYKVH
jgi:hypothetical protein